MLHDHGPMMRYVFCSYFHRLFQTNQSSNNPFIHYFVHYAQAHGCVQLKGFLGTVVLGHTINDECIHLSADVIRKCARRTARHRRHSHHLSAFFCYLQNNSVFSGHVVLNNILTKSRRLRSAH